jgi:hypothetical protein
MNTPMPSPRIKVSRRAVGWFLPAAMFALTPKCVICVVAYAGLGAALGLGRSEICGASAGSPGSWASWLAWLSVAGTLGMIGFLASGRCALSAPTGKSNGSSSLADHVSQQRHAHGDN